MFVTGGSGTNSDGAMTSGLIGQLISLMVAEKSGFALSDSAESNGLKEYADRLTEQALTNMQQSPDIPATASRK